MSKDDIDTLRDRFLESGRRISLCSSGRLPEVFEELEGRYRSGEIFPEIYNKYLRSFAFSPPAAMSNAQAVLVVAMPIGRTRLILDLEERQFQAIIPPTYGADDIIGYTQTLLSATLRTREIGFTLACLPNKLLAAHTGLARYGRDNILRFDGLGSFVRLDTWWIDVDASGESWGPAQMLERCSSCGLCAKACPNGCFTEGRFLLDASRCLTYLNEGSSPFPAWINPKSHNSVVGCLRCQDVCPENRESPGKNIIRTISLDREASLSILKGKPVALLPPSAVEAVRAAEMVGCEDRLARNLRALIAAQGI